MAGFQRVFVAAMLQPVDALSDDDLVAATTPMRRPAGKAKAKPTPKSSPKPNPVASSTQATPKSKAKGGKGMKRPAASVQNVEGDQNVEPVPVLKKPAAKDSKDLKVYKYLYRATGVWGFKKNGKEVLRAPHMHLFFLLIGPQVISVSHSNPNLLIPT